MGFFPKAPCPGSHPLTGPAEGARGHGGQSVCFEFSPTLGPREVSLGTASAPASVQGAPIPTSCPLPLALSPGMFNPHTGSWSSVVASQVFINPRNQRQNCVHPFWEEDLSLSEGLEKVQDSKVSPRTVSLESSCPGWRWGPCPNLPRQWRAWDWASQGIRAQRCRGLGSRFFQAPYRSCLLWTAAPSCCLEGHGAAWPGASPPGC